MAYQRPGEKLSSHAAGADLTGSQFLAVDVSAEGEVDAATADTAVVGVLQNNPNVGEAAEVMTTGETKAIAGAAILVGVEVEVEAGGKFITQSAGVKKGVALSAAGADGDLITVLLQG